ncbi:MAG: hypothetical protein LAT68_14810 [Cyclobacteriaceae bacterium]|nr:hypothetical protein [Cyclobacteriaceae bacterium]MCH8517591.1 hypothetical protein [Cyclobacteriaceae bacterium]
MKVSVTLFLAFLMLLHAFMYTAIQAGYELNKEYIAQVLCINQDRPELACEGKCFLMSQMDQAKEDPKGNAEKAPFSFFVIQAFASLTKNIHSKYSADCFTYIEPHIGLLTADIFHPPQ